MICIIDNSFRITKVGKGSLTSKSFSTVQKFQQMAIQQFSIPKVQNTFASFRKSRKSLGYERPKVPGLFLKVPGLPSLLFLLSNKSNKQRMTYHKILIFFLLNLIIHLSNLPFICKSIFLN